MRNVFENKETIFGKAKYFYICKTVYANLEKRRQLCYVILNCVCKALESSNTTANQNKTRKVCKLSHSR